MYEAQNLQSLRVLVVEDETLVAMLIEDMCADLCCDVVGPATTLEDALKATSQGDFDVAVIDMNLAGLKADPVIAELRRRSIPFAIASGAAEVDHDPRVNLVLSKPFSFDQLADCMAKLAAQLRARP